MCQDLVGGYQGVGDHVDQVATFYYHLEFYLDLELQVEHVEQVVTTFLLSSRS